MGDSMATPTMSIEAILPALLAAERALGRLDQALADPACRHRHAFDAARRSAVATVRMDDGRTLDPVDLLRAFALPDQATGGAWRAAMLAAFSIRIDAGLTAIGTADDPRLDPGVVHDRRLAAGRRAAMAAALGRDLRAGVGAATESLDDRDGAGAAAGHRHRARFAIPVPTIPGPPIPGSPIPRSPILVPWTLPWLEELYGRWSVVEHGRSARLTAAQRQDAAVGLDRRAEALAGGPGLLGAAPALLALLTHEERPAPESRGLVEDGRLHALRRAPATGPEPPSFWRTLAWLAGSALIREACRLRHGAPALAPMVVRDPIGHRQALADPGAFVRWFVRAVGAAADRDLDRLHALARTDADRAGRLTGGGRRCTSRLPDLLPWLHERPAYAIPRVAAELKARFGLSKRGVHLLTAQLAGAGIVTPLPVQGQPGLAVWCTGLGFPPGEI